MNSWYEKAHEQLDEDHRLGHMSDKEYMQAVRDLDQEYREMAEEAAQETYNSYY